MSEASVHGRVESQLYFSTESGMSSRASGLLSSLLLLSSTSVSAASVSLLASLASVAALASVISPWEFHSQKMYDLVDILSTVCTGLS